MQVFKTCRFELSELCGVSNEKNSKNAQVKRARKIDWVCNVFGTSGIFLLWCRAIIYMDVHGAYPVKGKLTKDFALQLMECQGKTRVKQGAHSDNNHAAGT